MGSEEEKKYIYSLTKLPCNIKSTGLAKVSCYGVAAVFVKTKRKSNILLQICSRVEIIQNAFPFLASSVLSFHVL